MKSATTEDTEERKVDTAHYVIEDMIPSWETTGGDAIVPQADSRR